MSVAFVFVFFLAIELFPSVRGSTRKCERASEWGLRQERRWIAGSLAHNNSPLSLRSVLTEPHSLSSHCRAFYCTFIAPPIFAPNERGPPGPRPARSPSARLPILRS